MDEKTLYELGKEFVERNAKIKMPAVEDFEVYEQTTYETNCNVTEWCCDNNKRCEDCKTRHCHERIIEEIQLTYKDKRKRIYLSYNYMTHDKEIIVTKFKKYHCIQYRYMED